MAARKSQRFFDVADLKSFNRELTTKLFRAKMEHGQLFLFRIKDKKFLFRPLTVKELEGVVSLSKVLIEPCIEDWIVENCFIGNEAEKEYLLTKTPFLYVANFASKIISLSTVQTEDEYKKIVIDGRTKINTIQTLVERIICKAYKGYDQATVKNMTQRMQLELLPKAENIAEEQIQFDSKKQKRKSRIGQFTEGATVIGTDEITSPAAADKPDF